MVNDLRERVARAFEAAGIDAEPWQVDAALAEMGAVRVTELTWDEDPRGGWKRGRIVGLSPLAKTEATIFRVEGGWQYIGDVYLTAHDNLEAALDRAKATAQADYAARILAAIEPAPQEPEKYTIGDLTMNRVFKAAGLTNVSDMQAVFDQVEVALHHAIEPAPVSVREAARVLCGSAETPFLEPASAITRELRSCGYLVPVRILHKVLRAIAEGKDDE